METLRFAWASTEIGRFLVARSSRGVCFLALKPNGARADFRRWAERHAPGSESFEDEQGLSDVCKQLEEYARGERERFELELDMRGTEFQRSVWRELQRIPFGSTRTYLGLAQRLKRPLASRAVGSANGANPVPIIVPCHRVLAQHGLGGFGGGLPLKRRLLTLEGALLPL